MSERKGSAKSVLEKIAIAALGVAGGLLIGKVVSDSKISSSKVEQKDTEKPSKYTKNVEDYDNIEELMTCPISGELMADPVIVTECGHTF